MARYCKRNREQLKKVLFSFQAEFRENISNSGLSGLDSITVSHFQSLQQAKHFKGRIFVRDKDQLQYAANKMKPEGKLTLRLQVFDPLIKLLKDLRQCS